jgi:hypothetical protein
MLSLGTEKGQPPAHKTNRYKRRARMPDAPGVTLSLGTEKGPPPAHKTDRYKRRARMSATPWCDIVPRDQNGPASWAQNRQVQEKGQDASCLLVWQCPYGPKRANLLHKTDGYKRRARMPAGPWCDVIPRDWKGPTSCIRNRQVQKRPGCQSPRGVTLSLGTGPNSCAQNRQVQKKGQDASRPVVWRGP